MLLCITVGPAWALVSEQANTLKHREQAPLEGVYARCIKRTTEAHRTEYKDGLVAEHGAWAVPTVG